MYVVKVRCGFEEPSIAPPFADIAQALRWIAANAWREFDGDAERAEIFELDALDRRLVLREARAGRGRLVRTEQRPPTPEQCRRAAQTGGEN
ncbi:hypothetical protein [Bradyrhizobium sp. LHD-71]|uniref:hypothetical protein n=1 Tax=Bradyrhizobium sp. LHD-71 TaxID=3072141 RepID=UPI00280F4168|nr:hypothetical protein [Bradyrhizobium sp. LHD-71]MDQ8729119.1 hypothetical protein [Bradyrhizobium sp. LHD-71]